MKLVSRIALCATAALLLVGCAQRPLSDTEFRGFCYTTIGHRNSCDTLGICDDYDTNVLSEKHASKQACNEKCAAVYNNLYVPNLLDGCTSTVLMAYNWCQKYCNTNYSE
jgi:hypothetical protein